MSEMPADPLVCACMCYLCNCLLYPTTPTCNSHRVFVSLFGTEGVAKGEAAFKKGELGDRESIFFFIYFYF